MLKLIITNKLNMFYLSLYALSWPDGSVGRVSGFGPRGPGFESASGSSESDIGWSL